MAGFSPFGTDYGVDDTTLTYMYNPNAPRPDVSVAPAGWNLPIYGSSPSGNGSMLFEPSSATPMVNNAGVVPNAQNLMTPMNQGTQPIAPVSGFSTPEVVSPQSATPMSSGFSPISGPAYGAVNGNSSYSPMMTQAAPNAMLQQQGMFGGVGDAVSSGWDSIGGWQGVQSGLQAATGIFQAYQGMKALDLAKDKFGFQKDAWQQNYNMQKDAYDRQVAQVESRKSFLQRGGSELEENQ